MGIYINNRPTMAPIGSVGMFDGDNNTTPSVITKQVRANRIKALQPQSSEAAQLKKTKSIFTSLGTLLHPVTKSDFTSEELCGADVKAQHLDILA